MKLSRVSACFQWFFFPLVLTACSSAPKVSEDKVSLNEAETWFRKYCSATAPQSIRGDLVLKSSTREFKGQFPASVAFNPDGTFQLEVTNIVGGTIAQLHGHPDSMDIAVSGRPKLSRSGVTHYLGLDMPVLIPLLRGELPCPESARSRPRVEVEGNAMKIHTSNWDWYFYRSTADAGQVPARIVLKSGKQTIEMDVEDWSDSEHYLKKGHVHSPEGELKWTWRSRTKD